jgi:hypothetical protein
MFHGLKIGHCQFSNRIFHVNNQLCCLSASKVKDKKGIPELQISLCFDKPEKAQETYKERRQVETAFRAMKSSGFHIEDTHPRDIDRIDKRFAPVIVPFTRAYKVGIYVHLNIKEIKTKKLGRKQFLCLKSESR